MATGITNWVGKRVWIIGASFGIGRALAERLADQGAQLVLSGRTEAALTDLKSTLSGEGHLVYPLDVGSEDSISQAFQNIKKSSRDVDGPVLK